MSPDGQQWFFDKRRTMASGVTKRRMVKILNSFGENIRWNVRARNDETAGAYDGFTQLIRPEAGHLGSVGEIQRRQRMGGHVELLLQNRCVIKSWAMIVPAARVRQPVPYRRTCSQAPSTPDARRTIRNERPDCRLRE